MGGVTANHRDVICNVTRSSRSETSAGLHVIMNRSDVQTDSKAKKNAGINRTFGFNAVKKIKQNMRN
jgi:hypothetical protein